MIFLLELAWWTGSQIYKKIAIETVKYNLIVVVELKTSSVSSSFLKVFLF